MRKLSDLVETEGFDTGCKKIERIERVQGTPLELRFDGTQLWAVSVFLCGETVVVSAESKKKKMLESETVFATRNGGR